MAKKEINNIKENIEITREKLNKKIIENEGDLNSRELIELSEELDNLIVQYYSLVISS